MTRFIESNVRETTNNSDPRLGSLITMHTSVYQSNSNNTTENNFVNSDLWNDVTPDFRPGDLVVIRSQQLGLR